MESLDAFADKNSVGILGTDEIIERWYDYMSDDRLGFLDAPVFSLDEMDAIKRFHYLLECTYNKKEPSTWQHAELEGCKEWLDLVAAARDEYAIFTERGLSDEDR